MSGRCVATLSFGGGNSFPQCRAEALPPMTNDVAEGDSPCDLRREARRAVLATYNFSSSFLFLCSRDKEKGNEAKKKKTRRTDVK